MTAAWNAFWNARNPRERRMLALALVACLAALLYLLLIEPATTGRDALRRDLPALRQQAVQMQSMAQQASRLTQAPPPQPLALSQPALLASLQRGGINADNITTTERSARLQVSAASLSDLLAWLEQVHTQRLSVSEATIDTLPDAATVKASITLIQGQEEQQ